MFGNKQMLFSPRLIKHTGYGNAAGLLARRGLMAGGRLVKNFGLLSRKIFE